MLTAPDKVMPIPRTKVPRQEARRPFSVKHAPKEENASAKRFFVQGIKERSPNAN